MPRTRDVVIRPFVKTDAAAFVEAARESAASVGPWLAWCHAGYTLDEAHAWFLQCEHNLRSGFAYEYGLFDSESGSVLGGVAINLVNCEHNFANIGYWTRSSHQGRGIASQAARLMASYGFGELRFTRLEILAAEGNLASRRVAEKVGAVFEGLARNRLIIHGVAHAAAVYSLVPGQDGY